METFRFTRMDSPVGWLLVAGNGGSLRLIRFASEDKSRQPRPDWREDAGPFQEVIRQLRAYFNGTLREFNLPLGPEGTPFQLAVWDRLRQIPYGATISYGELARRIGRPRAPRAVGLANGANPLPIVIPCHRVIGSNGKLTGYGGGLAIKDALLALERGQLRF